jgi:hypothetical protein
VDAMTALSPANVALLIWKSSIFSMCTQTKPNTSAQSKGYSKTWIYKSKNKNMVAYSNWHA